MLPDRHPPGGQREHSRAARFRPMTVVSCWEGAEDAVLGARVGAVAWPGASSRLRIVNKILLAPTGQFDQLGVQAGVPILRVGIGAPADLEHVRVGAVGDGVRYKDAVIRLPVRVG